MIDFLLDCGIDQDVIKDIENGNSEAILYTLMCNEFEVVKIIDYFREIGIEYINELLAFNIEVFLLKHYEILEKFSKYDIEEVVNKINDDYMLIDEILS